MPSYADLEAEPWWDRELVSAELDWLGDALCDHYQRPRTAAGTKGDNGHTRGAHRSQEWILNSRWCTSRTYTVQPGLSATQLRLIAGLDFTPGIWGTTANRAEMAAITRRLVDAAKAGQLPGWREIGGTLDGRTPFGWHVTRGVTLSFDSSHVDHLHLTGDRTAMQSRAVMENAFKIMIGDDMFEQPDRNTAQADTWRTFTLLANLPAAEYQLQGEAKPRREVNGLKLALDRLEAAAAADATRDTATAAAIDALAELVRSGGGDADTAAILARIDERAMAARVLAEQVHQVEMAKLAELHAETLRDRDARIAALEAELNGLKAG